VDNLFRFNVISNLVHISLSLGIYLVFYYLSFNLIIDQTCPLQDKVAQERLWIT
jgi:hypothetical protein